jgi:prevent-host-death family protein
MKTMTAAKAKLHFGEFLDTVQREPVVVTKKNRPVGIMLSMQDIEDTIWGEQARKADAEGYVDADESEALLKALANAKD